LINRDNDTRTRAEPNAEDASAGGRLGFMAGEGSVPDDFDRLGETEIIAAFEGPTRVFPQHSSRRARQNPL
jgi:hypothetical protein